MGHCKVNVNLCSAGKVWCSLHWGLRQDWAGGFDGLWFYVFVEISRGGDSTRQPLRTGPWQCASGQPWALHGALQGQMQPMQCAAGVVEPALGAAAGLGRWFVGEAFLLVCCGDFQRRRQHLATTEYCQCVSGQPWACHGALQGQMQPLLCAAGVMGPALGPAAGPGRWLMGGCCGFAGLCSWPEEEAALGNLSAQSPASV